MKKSKNAFTLIEVLVSVMIISVVIMALITMHSNTTHLYERLKQNIKINQIETFFISVYDHGFNKESIYVYDILQDFKVDDDLRRKLKNIKVEISYKKMNLFKTDTAQDIFELGHTTIKLNNQKISLIRIKSQ